MRGVRLGLRRTSLRQPRQDPLLLRLQRHPAPEPEEGGARPRALRACRVDEDLVWRDVKGFLENPGEVLERLREQMQGDGEGEALTERHADLTKRLGQKEAEKDRYVRLYAQGHINDSELLPTSKISRSKPKTFVCCSTL